MCLLNLVFSETAKSTQQFSRSRSVSQLSDAILFIAHVTGPHCAVDKLFTRKRTGLLSSSNSFPACVYTLFTRKRTARQTLDCLFEVGVARMK